MIFFLLISTLPFTTLISGVLSKLQFSFDYQIHQGFVPRKAALCLNHIFFKETKKDSYIDLCYKNLFLSEIDKFWSKLKKLKNIDFSNLL